MFCRLPLHAIIIDHRLHFITDFPLSVIFVISFHWSGFAYASLLAIAAAHGRLLRFAGWLSMPDFHFQGFRQLVILASRLLDISAGWLFAFWLRRFIFDR